MSPRTSRGGAWFAACALLIGTAACTALIDHDATQCRSDSDCAKFGDHPYCEQGLCVPSGLGPASCFYGTPQQPPDFMNQCSTAACLSFSNCQRLQLCSGATDIDAALITPPPPQSSAPADAGAGDGGVPQLPLCMDPNNGRGQVVVLTGSSNFPPLLAKLAPLILATGYTPVYQVTSSCNGVASVFDTGSAQVLQDPAPGPSAKYAAYFQQDGSSVSCTLGPVGEHVDVGESDIFSTTCSGTGLPGDGVQEYLGPIQAMLFVVPGQSQETAITADAARAVFGMGGDNGLATPWTDPTLYFVRNGSTGTQQMIGHAIDVPASAFWGQDRGSAANVDALMKTISDPTVAEQAIGIISADYYDADRANLKALAFAADGQTCAYLPDSTPYKTDKQNVRDGHYPIWGPVHFFTAVSGGVPVSPAAQAFVSVVSVPNIPQALLDAFIASSLVPTCAMSVQRSSELGDLSTYSPPFQCGCYFEASPTVNGAPPSSCAPCKTGNDCTDPTHPACNLGYCEVQ
jgi:hypothetical protein